MSREERALFNFIKSEFKRYRLLSDDARDPVAMLDAHITKNSDFSSIVIDMLGLTDMQYVLSTACRSTDIAISAINCGIEEMKK